MTISSEQDFPLLSRQESSWGEEIYQSASASSIDGYSDGVAASVASEPSTITEEKPKIGLRYIVPAISVGVFLAALDQTITVSSYGSISNDLKALNLSNWIATSYLLTVTAFQPLYGRLSDIFGRKPCLLSAYAIFGAGCIVCGLAANIHVLIAARLFQGIGGGAMTTVVTIILNDIVPLRDLGMWHGVMNVIFAMGSGIGAPLGGILSDSVGWRWAFILQAPVCLAAFIAVFFTLNLPAQKTSAWREKLRRVDFWGAISLIFAVLALLVGLDRGSNLSWSTPITIISLTTSLILFILFVWVESYISTEPFAPRHIIFGKSLLACHSASFFGYGGWMATLFYIPLYFQASSEGVQARVAGLRLLPCILAAVSGALYGGFAMRRTGRYYWLAILGFSSMTTGLVLVFLFSGDESRDDNNISLIITGTALCGFGNGLGVTASLTGLVANASLHDQPVAIATLYLFRSLGSVIGISLSATVIQQSLKDSLRSSLHWLDDGDIDWIIEGVQSSLDFVKDIDPDIQQIVTYCYGQATNRAFLFMVGIASCALLSSVFIREMKLSH